jgi:hypothetical protein
MPLSEHEKHLLQDIERSLTIADPDLAATLGSVRSVRRLLRSRILMGVAVLAGLILSLVGTYLANAVGIGVAVIGFALIVVGANELIRITQRQRRRRHR